MTSHRSGISHHTGDNMNNEKFLELLVDIGNIWNFDNFQEFVENRKKYGDKWTYNWPKIATCKNCQGEFELAPEDFNDRYFSSRSFESQTHYPTHEVHLIAIIQCPICISYFKYIASGR